MSNPEQRGYPLADFDKAAQIAARQFAAEAGIPPHLLEGPTSAEAFRAARDAGL